jgi:hypothetical protein
MKTFKLVVVITIFAAIVGYLFIIAYGPIHSHGRDQDTRGQLYFFTTALARYKLYIGAYPEKLDYLWFCPPNMEPEKWQGPYMDGYEVIPDAWDRPFRYEVFDKGQKCKITSAGPDGKFGTEDDISKTYCPEENRATTKRETSVKP